jgi:carboxyl-terminal processing protease
MLEGGNIVHFRQKGDLFETIHATNKKITKLPAALLINGGSASASEILAGALKDNKAAVLVGETTYGKGVAQLMGYTNDGSPYKISIYYFLTPDMHDIEGIGIAPDYAVKNSISEFKEEAAEAYSNFAPFAENAKPAAGDVGLNVYAAQQRLSLLGYDVSVTAVMDEKTVSALKQFQREHGLYAGGVLDYTTRDKIEEVTLFYITGESDEDLQLAKAIELLKK